jgi:putative sterol carrier protein
VRQVVYTSSMAAYGVVAGHPDPIVESTLRVHQRQFPYAAAKFEVEQFLDEFAARAPQLKVVRLRPAIFLGAGMEHPLARLLRRRLLVDTRGIPLPLVWDEDVAEAIALALKSDAAGAFNLAAAEPRCGAELARACGLGLIKVPPAVAVGAGQLLPLLAKLRLTEPIDPAWTRVADVRMIIDSEKARRELGWKPRCATATEVVQRFVDTVPVGLDPRLRVFFAALRLVGPRGPQMEEARHLSARIHLRLTGRNGGDVGVTVADGRLVTSSTPPRPPNVTVTLKADTLLQLLAGELDYATAQLTGRVRVDGEALAALVVQGMVSIFRAQTQTPGVAGALPRRLQRWFAHKGAVA